eukprot:GFUD01010155.1.p1 GENE.GFUD01010155.1~~GFUD01010155.1.p1  ORF type:complete len:303 (+),score=96.41 GFUD01010155.1:221-1129(+)
MEASTDLQNNLDGNPAENKPATIDTKVCTVEFVCNKLLEIKKTEQKQATEASSEQLTRKSVDENPAEIDAEANNSMCLDDIPLPDDLPLQATIETLVSNAVPIDVEKTAPASAGYGDLLVEDALENDDNSGECSLAEEAAETKEVKDPLSLSLYDSKPNESSWRGEPEEVYSDEDYSDEEYTSDSEEENAREYMQMMQMRQTQALKVKGPNGEVKITHIPAGIKVTRVPESKEARLKREQELARRKEQAMKGNLESCASPMKRKHGERMNLEDVRREDFEEAQDYVDFLQSKLKNISIKTCK